MCLRKIQLRGDKPIRHGFAAIGVKHGVQQGGYHTGPCEGIDFPHLGISDAGTKHALLLSTKRLANVVDQLEHLATNPPLTWTPRTGRTSDFANAVTITLGATSSSLDGRPSYKYLHKQRVDTTTHHAQQIGEQIKAYHKVIDDYSPSKYPTTGTPAKQKTVHLAEQLRNVRYGEWTGPSCTRTRGAEDAKRYDLTTDPKKVTCSKCKRTPAA